MVLRAAVQEEPATQRGKVVNLTAGLPADLVDGRVRLRDLGAVVQPWPGGAARCSFAYWEAACFADVWRDMPGALS